MRNKAARAGLITALMRKGKPISALFFSSNQSSLSRRAALVNLVTTRSRFSLER
jgi:hypothetical protein